MAFTPPSAKTLVDGAYEALTNAAPSVANETLFAASMNVPFAQLATTPASFDKAYLLSTSVLVPPGPNTFKTLAANLSAKFPDAGQFLDQLSIDLSGTPVTIAAERNGFINWLQNPNGVTRGDIAGVFIDAVLGNIDTQSLVNAGLSAADLKTFSNQQQAAQNRATIGAEFAAAAVQLPSLLTGPYAQLVIQGVDQTSATVFNAEAQIQAALASKDPTKITGQGGPGPVFNLTVGADTFSTSAASAVFNALPAVNAFGNQLNTLNIGDSLSDSNNDGTLNYVAAVSTTGANPPFATNVTMSGIKTAAVTSQMANAASALPPVVALIGGFQGNVTGLTVVNDQNSLGTVQIGNVGQGVNTPLTNVNVSGYAGANGTYLFENYLKGSAGAATNAISVAIAGAVGGTLAAGAPAGSADKILLAGDGAPGTAAAPNLSYGSWTISTDSTSNLQLMQGGVGGATSLTLKGAGNVAVGQDVAGNWQKLTTIDASGETGAVYITGAVGGAATNAIATVANVGGLFGSAAGLLDDTGATFGLTSFKLGTGVNTLDATSATAAQLGALTTTPAATVAATNEIIVASAVADTTLASTFANIKGFSILGDVGAAGVINLANLPSSINDIFYQTAATGAVTINNQTSALTVDTEDNGAGFALTVGAIGPAPGLADSLSLIVGNNTKATAGAVGPVSLNGDEIVNITAQGAAGDTVGTVTLTPSLIGNEQVTIGGANTVTIAGIADVTAFGGATLFTNNMTIKVTDTAAVTLTAPGAPLTFVPVGDTTALAFSNNAASIDASKSGGLIMAAGDANYTSAATVAGSVGDTIIGSTTKSNVLGGSIGNDTITGTTTGSVADTIFTDGGADTITLAAGHTVADHIGLYAASGLVAPGAAATVIAGSITDATDKAQLGSWGLPTSGAAAQFGVVAVNAGTSLDQSTVANFVAGTAAAPQDILDFGVTAWGVGAGIHGLTNGGLTVSPVAGTVATVAQVALGATVTAASNFIELTGGTFQNANQVVTTLRAAATDLKFTVGAGGLGAGDNSHVLLGYQDIGGTSHVMDLELTSVAAIAAGGTYDTALAGNSLHGSDIVQLTGVPITSINGNGVVSNIHFV